MTGFEKLTEEQIIAFIERNQSSPLQRLVDDAKTALLEKRLVNKVITGKKSSGEPRR